MKAKALQIPVAKVHECMYLRMSQLVTAQQMVVLETLLVKAGREGQGIRRTGDGASDRQRQLSSQPKLPGGFSQKPKLRSRGASQLSLT